MLVGAFEIHVGLPLRSERGGDPSRDWRRRNSGRRIRTARDEEPESIHTSSVSSDLATASGPVQSSGSRAPKVRRRFFRTRRSSRVARSGRRHCGRSAHRGSDRLPRRKMPGSARPRCAGARCTSPGAIDGGFDAVLAPVRNPVDTLDFASAFAKRGAVAFAPEARAWSILMNHWSIARKMTGVLLRQQWG